MTRLYSVHEKMLYKIKLCGKMKIFEKIEKETSVRFRKTGHKERENIVRVGHGKGAAFQSVLLPSLVDFLRAPPFYTLLRSVVWFFFGYPLSAVQQNKNKIVDTLRPYKNRNANRRIPFGMRTPSACCKSIL